MRRQHCSGQSVLEYGTLITVIAIGMSVMITYGQRATQATFANLEDEVNDAVQEDLSFGAQDDRQQSAGVRGATGAVGGSIGTRAGAADTRASGASSSHTSGARRAHRSPNHELGL